MKHVGEFGQSTSNVGGIYGKQHQEARVIYFRVDRKGVIKDWATEFYNDKIVKTSNGQSIEAWRSGK
jgi:hypothetical protein